MAADTAEALTTSTHFDAIRLLQAEACEAWMEDEGVADSNDY